MWTHFVAEYAHISVAAELDDSFRSGIFAIVSSFPRRVLRAPCSFSNNHCLQRHEKRCQGWCQSCCGLEASTSHLHVCAWRCSCLKNLPESQELLPRSQQHTVNPWGATAASRNPDRVFPVELTHSEDDEIIHRFIGRDSLSRAIFGLGSRKLTVMLQVLSCGQEHLLHLCLKRNKPFFRVQRCCPAKQIVRKSKEPGMDPIRRKSQWAGHCKDRWSRMDNGRTLGVKLKRGGRKKKGRVPKS